MEVGYYSQFQEDKIFVERFLPNIPEDHRFYIELGALDGVRYSNTKTLEDHFGWTGILIEPVPTAYQELKRNRPKNILSNSIVSDSADEVEFVYFEAPSLSAVSAVSSTASAKHNQNWFQPHEDGTWLDNQIRNKKKCVRVQPRTLDSIILESKMSNFGLVSVDVEGHEFSVLNSLSWNNSILYFIVELNDDQRIVELLKEKGYKLVEQSHLSYFFARADCI